jgi:CBS domain-containing protein
MHEAWGSLLESGAHHVPVTRGAEVAGVVTANDLLKASAPGPMAVLRDVERLASRGSLPGYGARVAEMGAALLAGGLDAAAIGQLVSRLDDALLARILAWAEADLGPAPAPWAWLALAAEGRREQSLLAGRNDALAFADQGGEGAGWYDGFFDRVSEDLVAAGFPPGRARLGAGRSVASLSEWTRRLDEWVDERRPRAAAHLLDFRKVGGPLEVAPLQLAVDRARGIPAFLRHLARFAVEHAPPGALRLRLRGGGTVDLEAQGILPVADLARCYGLEVGALARGTLERLEAAAEAGLVSQEAHESVAHAYRFLLGLRLRHELRMLAEGGPPGAQVRASDLSAIERSRLKESFRAIARWQERAAFHYRTDFI